LISLGTGVLTVNAGGGDITIVNGGGLVSGSSYNLITFGSGAGAGFATGIGTTVGDLVLTDPSLAFGLSGYLTVTSTGVQLTATGASLPTAYWSGVAGATWTGTNGGGGNFTTDAAGLSQAQAYPSANTNVIFSASNAQNFTETLGANFGVHSVTFSGSNNVTINNDGNTLTVGAGGLTVQSGAGNITLGANLAGSGAVTANSSLLALLGTNSYTGGTIINSGTVQINSSNSLGSSSGAVQLAAGTTLEALNTASSANSFALTGDPTIQVDSGTYTISGVIADGSSPGTLVETGSGTLVLANTETYSGQTQITSGTLQLGNGTTDGVLANTSAAVDNSALVFDPVGTDTAAYGISGTGSVAQIGAGETNLSGSNSYSGGTAINSGTLEFQGYTSMSGSTALTLASGPTLSLRADTSGTFTPASFGNMASAGSYNINVNSLTGSGTGNTLSILAPSASGGGTTNTTLVVSSTSGDTLQFTTLFGTTSNSGLAWAGPINVFTLNGANVVLNGLYMANGGDGFISINSTTGNSLTINGLVGTNGNRTLGAIVNSGVLILNNTVNTNYNNGGATNNQGFYIAVNGGTLDLNNAVAINTNIYAAHGVQALTITSGTLNNTSGAALTESTNPTVGLNGNFAFGTSAGTSLNSLNLGVGNIYLSATPTITTNGSGTLSLSGAIQASAYGITKAGTGTLKLGGVDAYTGATTVNGGTLIVSGSLSATSSVSVASGANLEVDGGLTSSATAAISGSLTGTGSVGPINATGGAIAAGLSTGSTAAGVLTANGNVSLDSTSTLSLRLGILGVSGTDGDQLGVNGTFSLDNSNLLVTIGNSVANAPTGTQYIIVNGGATLALGIGSGADVFADAPGGVYTNGAYVFNVEYGFDPTTQTVDSGGTDIALELVAVPEPATWAMMFSGAFVLLAMRRIRRRRC